MIVFDKDTKIEYDIDIQHAGENYMRCPVCSDDRKKRHLKCFSYNTEKQSGKCAHCDVVLIKKNEEFVKREIKQYKTPIFKNDTQLSDKVVKWFRDRQISQKTLLELKVTEGLEWMPQTQKEENTIQFNYFRDGEIVNTKYRDAKKNFKLFKDAELIFYNIDCLKENNEVIIVEGEMDALSLWECGFKNVISVPNGANLNRNNLVYLDNCIDLFLADTKIILALDNDKAGNNLRDELARRFGFEMCSKVTFKDCKDANECLLTYGTQGVAECIKNREEYPLEGVFSAKDIDAEIDDYYYNGLPNGAKLNIPQLDERLEYHLGYLSVITGIPSHGKSEVLDFMLCKLSTLSDWKFALYSPENYPLQLHFSKIAEKLIGKPFSGSGKMNEMELRLAKEFFDNHFYFIKPEKNFALDNILASVKSLIRKKGVNAFIIDAWNKLEHNYDNESRYISKELDKITMFTETNHVHCFLVAHPTKIQKDKVTGKFEIPNLYSINGSANWYNKAHNGITVYRDFETNKTYIYFQKIKFKHWGSVGHAEMTWNGRNGRYHSLTSDDSNWLLKEQPQQTIPLEPTIKPNNDFTQPNIQVNNGGFVPREVDESEPF
jgi:twinkle protein